MGILRYIRYKLFNPSIDSLVEKRDLKGLIWALGAQEDSVCTKAIDAIVAIGETAVDELSTVLMDASEPWLRRKNSAVTLGRLECSIRPDVLISALRDPNRNVQQGAAWATGLRKLSEAVPGLSDVLFDSGASWFTKATMAEALIRINSKESRLAASRFIEHIEDQKRNLADGERTPELSALYDYLTQRQFTFGEPYEAMKGHLLMTLDQLRSGLDAAAKEVDA